MDSRRCIYTNKDANTRDTVIPKDRGNVLHNWANRAPANSEYLKTKQDRLPTELEMEANRIFHLLELSRLDVVFFEEKLKEIQVAIDENKKDQIDKSYHIKELDESLDLKAEDIIKKIDLNKPKKIWD